MTLPTTPGYSIAHLALKFPLATAAVCACIYAANVSYDESLPTVVFTFDDGYASAETNVLPIMNIYKFPATSYLSTGLLNTQNYLSDIQVKNLVTYNWELGGHTINHDDMTKIPDAAQYTNLLVPQKYIEETYHVPASSFASPHGEFNSNTLPKIEQVYDNHVNAFSTFAGINTRETFDLYNIHRLVIKSDVNVKELCDRILSLKPEETFVMAFHDIIQTPNDEYDVSIENFKSITKCVNETNLNVLTLTQAANEMRK